MLSLLSNSFYGKENRRWGPGAHLPPWGHRDLSASQRAGALGCWWELCQRRRLASLEFLNTVTSSISLSPGLEGTTGVMLTPEWGRSGRWREMLWYVAILQLLSVLKTAGERGHLKSGHSSVLEEKGMQDISTQTAVSNPTRVITKRLTQI